LPIVVIDALHAVDTALITEQPSSRTAVPDLSQRVFRPAPL